MNNHRHEDGECLAWYTCTDIEHQDKPKLPVLGCFHNVPSCKAFFMYTIVAVFMIDEGGIVLDDALCDEYLLFICKEPG